VNLARLFARSSIYRATRGAPLWVLVALAVGFYLLAGIGKAEARTPQEAMQLCADYDATYSGSVNCMDKGGFLSYDNQCNVWSPSTTQGLVCGKRTGSDGADKGAVGWSYDLPQCVAPETYDTITHTCVNKDAACKALNDEPGRIEWAGTKETRGFVNSCRANGCNFGVKPGTGYVATDLGTSSAVINAEFQWTGACAPPPEAEPPPPDTPPQQECKDAGSMGDGTPIKMCVQRDGRVCITAPKSGKQLCWTPGETGEKTTENILQKREGGDKVAAPTPPTKPDVTQEGPSVKTTTTKHPTGTTIVTTTTNWKTNDNTNAGPNDDGVPDDGAPDGGTEGGSEGSVTDDGTCDNAPQVSGGDPLLANIIYQTWGTRCAARDANAVTSTGDINDCSQPFTVGPAKAGGDVSKDANVQKLKALRAQICGDESGQPEGGSDGTYGIGDESGVEAGLLDGLIGAPQEFGTDGLNVTGYGWARTCPQFPTVDFFGTPVDFNNAKLCDWMHLGGWFVMLIASIVAVRIIGGAV
jgi:hypothetical protein